jgi:hypothetical protein
MTLNEKQVLFTRLQAEFQVWCFRRGIEIIEAESFRPPAQAKLMAEQGKGIKNSNHGKKLARDLFRYLDGTVTWKFEDYVKMGEKWKSMHELCRWGGDFKGRDAVHFSFEHNGVM